MSQLSDYLSIQAVKPEVYLHRVIAGPCINDRVTGHKLGLEDAIFILTLKNRRKFGEDFPYNITRSRLCYR